MNKPGFAAIGIAVLLLGQSFSSIARAECEGDCRATTVSEPTAAHMDVTTPVSAPSGVRLVEMLVEWAQRGDVVDDSADVSRTQSIDDANELVISGPYERSSRSATGNCAACPRMALAVWYVDTKTDAVSTAFELEATVEGFEYGAYMLLEVSDDGRRISSEHSRCRRHEELAIDPVMIGSVDEDLERCTRLEVDWCLELGQRQYIECRREEIPIKREAIDQYWADHPRSFR